MSALYHTLLSLSMLLILPFISRNASSSNYFSVSEVNCSFNCFKDNNTDQCQADSSLGCTICPNKETQEGPPSQCLQDDHHDPWGIYVTCNSSSPERCNLSLSSDPQDIDGLGYCMCILRGMGYEIMHDSTGDGEACSSDGDTKLSELNAALLSFRSLLSRTIVGVYVSTSREKKNCWNAYSKWLCATHLPLFIDANMSDCGCNCNCNCTEDCCRNGSMRLRPHLSVCHNVLQQCPYYIPSEFQPPKEIIYGGYPAFDCPRPAVLRRLNDNGSCHSYCLCKNESSHCCIGAPSDASMAMSHSSAMLLLLLCSLLYLM